MITKELVLESIVEKEIIKMYYERECQVGGNMLCQNGLTGHEEEKETKGRC